MFYLRFMCLFVHSGVKHIICCVFLFVLLFLWIFLLALRYSPTFIFLIHLRQRIELLIGPDRDFNRMCCLVILSTMCSLTFYFQSSLDFILVLKQ